MSTPLHAAAWSTNTARIAELIAHGADPNARDGFGQAPLHLAARAAASAEAIRTLAELGADPAAADNDGWTPLHCAAIATTDPAIITQLIELGADPNARDQQDRTPLHCTAHRHGNPEIILTLLELGADPNAQDKYGNTALHMLATDTCRQFRPPMLVPPAIDHRQSLLQALDALIRHAADPELAAQDGRTPLEAAGEAASQSAELFMDCLLEATTRLLTEPTPAEPTDTTTPSM